jgi:hypothetical protein
MDSGRWAFCSASEGVSRVPCISSGEAVLQLTCHLRDVLHMAEFLGLSDHLLCPRHAFGKECY